MTGVCFSAIFSCMKYDETKVQRFFITCMAFFPGCRCAYSDWTCFGTLMHVPYAIMKDADGNELWTVSMIINDSVADERYVMTVPCESRMTGKDSVYLRDLSGVVKYLKELKRRIR